MIRSVICLIILASGIHSLASEISAKSAYRNPGISYQAYKTRARAFELQPTEDSAGRSAQDSAVTYKNASLPAPTTWGSSSEMIERFGKIRDIRWLTTADHPGFLRRSSWMYPDDGCFARAALAVLNMIKLKIVAPSKVFVFGDLSVKTANAPSGSVTWWYHVAPLVQVKGQKYVLDPAIQPQAPLKLEDWLALMSPDPGALEVAVCKSGSYTPNDACNRVSDGVEREAAQDQIDYLGDEWNRLDELNRNPVAELGDSPPWLALTQ